MAISSSIRRRSGAFLAGLVFVGMGCGAGGSAADDDGGRAGAGGRDAISDMAGGGGPVSAVRIVGGLDRLAISKSDPSRQLCVRLTLSSPNAGSVLPAIQTPAGWGVESAMAWLASGDCANGGPPSGAASASGGTGQIGWQGSTPCTIDVDVTLAFPPGTAGAAGSEPLTAQALAVSGC